MRPDLSQQTMYTLKSARYTRKRSWVEGSPDQVTLYKSVGVAVQDAVAARLVLDAAQASGVGTRLEV